MEKIILKNGQELTLVPMGVFYNELLKKRSFKFTSELTYDETKTLLSDSANLESIDYVLADGTKTTYTDCADMKALNVQFGVKIDETTTADVFTVEISTDGTEKKITTSANDIDMLESTLDTLLTTVIPSMMV